MLHVADWFFILFHTTLVLFNCAGWAWRRTRRLHLVTLALTAISWFLLGLWFGKGYCVCTDLHWRIRTALGQQVTEDTYIQYLVARLTGWTPSAELATRAAGIVFLAATLLSIALNIRDLKSKETARNLQQ